MGADDLAFLDIAASSNAGDTTVETAAQVAERAFIPSLMHNSAAGAEPAPPLEVIGQ